MALRDVYLKIETILSYSPVEPDDHVSPPIQYRRDCMRNTGHKDGTIHADEVNAFRLTAQIYRKYFAPHYLEPKPDKLVAADVTIVDEHVDKTDCTVVRVSLPPFGTSRLYCRMASHVDMINGKFTSRVRE